jgi:hypothetical protein
MVLASHCDCAADPQAVMVIHVRIHVAVLQIPHGSFAKLHQATWHAGPLFDGADSMSFFNLELADTNIVVRRPCHNAVHCNGYVTKVAKHDHSYKATDFA